MKAKRGKTMKIEITNEKAYVKLPAHLVILFDLKGFSYRCSKGALKNLIMSSSGHNVKEDVVSTELNGEMVWVSKQELEYNNLIENANVKCTNKSAFSSLTEIEDYYFDLREKYKDLI